MPTARVSEPQTDRRLQRFGAVIDALAELPDPAIDEEFARALEGRLLTDPGVERHLRVVSNVPVLQGWSTARARRILAGFAVAACLGGVAVFGPFGDVRESTTDQAIRPAPSIEPETPGARVGPRARASTTVGTVQTSTPPLTTARPPARLDPPTEPPPNEPAPPQEPSGPQDLLGTVTISGRRMLPTAK